MSLDPPTGDLADEVAPEHDPVVRMPRAMAPAEPEVPGTSLRTVLAIAALGAVLGATLGAVGIGIVYATWRVPHLRDGAAMITARHHRHRDAGVAFALDPDAGAERADPGNTIHYETTQQSLGAGRPLAVALRVLGVPRDEIPRAIGALRAFVNMRMLQPTDRIAVMRDPTSHALARVEYRRSTTQVWAAVRADTGAWRAERVEVVMSTSRVVAGFKVEGSVEASLRAAGLHGEIVPRITDVFAAMNLSPRLLGGDIVRVIVDEERMNGQFFRYGRIQAIDYRGAMGRRRAVWGGSAARGDWYDPQGNTWERGPLRSPVPGARISSRFDPHRMHPVLHVIKAHNGVDFAAPTGTAVYAAADGDVLSVGNAGPSGNLVRLRHAALGVESGYAHLSRFAPGLRAGMRVHVHQLIAYVGTTGRSTGPHLHFSIKRAGVFIDPLTLYGGRRSVPAGIHDAFIALAQRLGVELDHIAVNGETLDAAHEPAVADDGGAAGDAAVTTESESDDDPQDEGDEGDGGPLRSGAPSL